MQGSGESPNLGAGSQSHWIVGAEVLASAQPACALEGTGWGGWEPVSCQKLSINRWSAAMCGADHAGGFPNAPSIIKPRARSRF